MSFCVMEVPISSGVVNAIQLPLPHEEVGFTQRPGLSHGESLEVISDLNEFVVGVLEF